LRILRDQAARLRKPDQRAKRLVRERDDQNPTEVQSSRVETLMALPGRSAIGTNVEKSVVGVLEVMIARASAVIAQLTTDIRLAKRDYEPQRLDEAAETGCEDNCYEAYKRGEIDYETMVDRLYDDGEVMDRDEIEDFYPEVARGDSSENWEPIHEVSPGADLIDARSDWMRARAVLSKIRMANILDRSEWIVLHHDETTATSVVISTDCREKISIGFSLPRVGDTQVLRELNGLLGLSEPLFTEVRIPADFISQSRCAEYCSRTSRELLDEVLGGVPEGFVFGARSDNGSACGLRVTTVYGHGAESGFSVDGPWGPDSTSLVAMTASRCTSCDRIETPAPSPLSDDVDGEDIPDPNGEDIPF
jgi:hypothetical protein